MKHKNLIAVLSLALVVLMVSGANGCRNQPKTPTLPGFEALMPGADNVFLTAISRQAITFKTGVVVSDELDDGGRVVALRMRIGNQTGSISCDCPSGCDAIDCFLLTSPDRRRATCTGDCETDFTSCFGCGFWMRLAIN